MASHLHAQQVLAGYNCTIFAYGQTSTGKTFTMEGDTEVGPGGSLSERAGMIPRAVAQIFKALEASHTTEYTVRVSCLELYNEELQDLLTNEEKKLTIYNEQNGFVCF